MGLLICIIYAAILITPAIIVISPILSDKNTSKRKLSETETRKIKINCLYIAGVLAITVAAYFSFVA